jgi:hypothetical protein
MAAAEAGEPSNGCSRVRDCGESIRIPALITMTVTGCTKLPYHPGSEITHDIAPPDDKIVLEKKIRCGEQRWRLMLA